MLSHVPCPGCRRHVRIDDPRCPFCAEALPASLAGSGVRPGRRLGRAATFAFGAAVATATTLACGDDSSAPADAGRLDSGASRMDSGSSGSDSGTSMDGGGDRDSATATDSGADSGMSEDAGFDSGGGIAPPYGAPPPPE